MIRRLCLLFVVALALVGQTVPGITKTPYERFDCSMDFVQWFLVNGIDNGHTASIDSVTATNTGTGVDNTAVIISSSPAPGIVPGTRKVVYRVQNGNNGETYTTFLVQGTIPG